MTEKLGAFCLTVDAIVPIPESGWCEFCGSRHHFIRYRWTGTEWQVIGYDDRRVEKPENYTDDGI